MSNSIVLRKGARIGQPDAETDTDFLRECFLNNGNYDLAADLSSKQCVVLGRTGSGKSAILEEIKKTKNNVIEISPESLALNNLASSSVLRFFEGAGVHLDAFYVLLWKHVFSVELLKRKYRITDAAGQRRFLSALGEMCRLDKSKETVVEYLQQWGDKFWLSTEYRTSDIATKLENKLTGNLGIESGPIKLGGSGARSLTSEQKVEVLQHGQAAVNSIQIKELARVIDLLADDVFPPDGDSYYICIDDLDGEWVEDTIRFKLLKALIETIKTFQKIRSVKILITMRTDLMYSLFETIKSPGFQSEKFTGHYLHVKWSRNDLTEMLNRRVQYLFEHQYSGVHVSLHNILPSHISPRVKSIDYILDRTFFRPREAIAFLNRCIEKAENYSSITPQMIKDAEYLYSDDRLIALRDEWRREYPNLKHMIELLRGRLDGGLVGSYVNTKLESFCIGFSEQEIDDVAGMNALSDAAASDSKEGGLPFLQVIFSILYRTGCVGLKLTPQSVRIFSFHDNVNVDPYQIELTTRVYVHKAFWFSLSIKSPEFDGRAIT